MQFKTRDSHKVFGLRPFATSDLTLTIQVRKVGNVEVLILFMSNKTKREDKTAQSVVYGKKAYVTHTAQLSYNIQNTRTLLASSI